MDFIDDINFETRLGRREFYAFAQLPNFIDAAVGGAVYFDDVDVSAFKNGNTIIAFIARLNRRALGMFAIQGLSQDPGSGGLADAAGAGKDIGMSNFILLDCAFECGSDVELAYDFVEIFRPPFPGKNYIRHKTLINLFKFR
jgi:hypothetical protein